MAGALKDVRETGYGIVVPGIDELKLEEPEIMKQGGRYGVRLKASAPSIHMIRADIQAEVSPIVGSEKQSEEMIHYLLQEFEGDTAKIWQSNIFGKSFHELVGEDLNAKVKRMPEDAREKLRETLQRIYGIAFPKKDELDAYLQRIEEAKKRDHRKLGKELGLFMLTEEGPGFPFFLPNGMTLKNTLIDYWREVHKRYGYVEVSTPMILNRKLWERSGHWDHYKQNMYTTVIDDEDYAIKPMNCPGGMLVYKAQPHSYKELPLRVGELGLVHRHELSGALHGLFRVRCFTQDDAHIFMTWDQMKDEIKNVVRLFDEVYSTFGLTYQIELSTMPEDHMGELKDWQFAEKTLAEAITEIGKDYVVNEGDGAFYGPKLDFHLADSIGRTWQCGTIQLDMQLPERFELEYTGADGEKHRPVMIHRVVLGSIERFIGVITEHFAGAFPTWLAPEQVRVMPMTDRNIPCAQEVVKQLTDKGFRVTMDERNEKIGYKIREAQVHKIPYMIVIGDKDEEKGVISVRTRKTGETTAMETGEFIEKLAYEVENKLK